MKKHVSYPKIGQFRNVVKAIQLQSTYIGKDEDGKPIYDSNKKKPIVRFKGTVKLHGTNAAFSYNNQDGIWYQSRNNIITVDKDNAGFAQFASVRSELFTSMAKFIASKKDIDLDRNTLTVYGEWAGKGIQKGVAISELEKAFYIFGVKSTPIDGEGDSEWLNTEDIGLSSIKSGVFDINGFPAFSLNIDMSNPSDIQNRLLAITEAVEENCPVAHTFGIEGIGEGVVWSGEFEGTVHRFKVKGEKHSSSKVKTLASVDVEKLNSVKEFANYSVTENRVNQACNEVFGIGVEVDQTKLGEVIRWVIKDVSIEESDVLEASNLTSKDVNSSLAARVKDIFFSLKAQL